MKSLDEDTRQRLLQHARESVRGEVISPSRSIPLGALASGPGPLAGMRAARELLRMKPAR